MKSTHTHTHAHTRTHTHTHSGLKSLGRTPRNPQHALMCLCYRSGVEVALVSFKHKLSIAAKSMLYRLDSLQEQHQLNMKPALSEVLGLSHSTQNPTVCVCVCVCAWRLAHVSVCLLAYARVETCAYVSVCSVQTGTVRALWGPVEAFWEACENAVKMSHCSWHRTALMDCLHSQRCLCVCVCVCVVKRQIEWDTSTEFYTRCQRPTTSLPL